MLQQSDEELLILFQTEAQKHYAFNLLVKRHQEKVYYYCRKILLDHDDANDATQEVFLIAWNKLSGFRGDSKLSTWLYTIATNQSITQLRKKRKHLFQRIDDVQRSLGAMIDHSPLYDGDAIRKKLDQAVLALPHKQRIIFILKYFEEKKFSEIAAITGTTEGGLKASYHHAVKKITLLMAED